MKTASCWAALAVLSLSGAASSQEVQPPAPPKAVQDVLRGLREEGVDVDLKAGTVTIDVFINRRQTRWSTC